MQGKLEMTPRFAWRVLGLMLLAAGCSPPASGPLSAPGGNVHQEQAPQSTVATLAAPVLAAPHVHEEKTDVKISLERLCAPVVAVVARFPNHARSGNGVIVSREGHAVSVLTCAHVVKGTSLPSGVHIRLFPHNFLKPLPATDALPQIQASVAAIDPDRDLALLRMRCELPLSDVGSMMNQHDEEAPDKPYKIVSTSPDGALLVEDRWLPGFQPGQSGSPVYLGNSLVGLASGNVADLVGGVWISMTDIEDFLTSHVTQ